MAVRRVLIAALLICALVVASAVGAPGRVNFGSPTTNIRCFIGQPFNIPSAACIVVTPSRAADVRQGRAVRISVRSRLGGIPAGFTLDYGRQVRRFGLRCVSQFRGMTCVELRSGRGFTICREGVERLPGQARTICTGRPAPPAPTPIPPSPPPPSRCNPNYSPCVPNLPDVDCSDLDFTVRVIGRDVYDLDSDGDGFGCESS